MSSEIEEPNEPEGEIFPREDVERSRRNTRLQNAKFVREERERLAQTSHPCECPNCGKTAKELEWVYFRSPKWTWENLCGREGWLAICDDCDRQVDFICTILN